jgi:hypothetical protein
MLQKQQYVAKIALTITRVKGYFADYNERVAHAEN